MATERKTVWLCVVPGDIIFAHPEMEGAFQVDLIRTPDGWKQDDRRGRIEGMKYALSFMQGRARLCFKDEIAQLEKEIADAQ